MEKGHVLKVSGLSAIVIKLLLPRVGDRDGVLSIKRGFDSYFWFGLDNTFARLYAMDGGHSYNGGILSQKGNGGVFDLM